MSPPCALYRHYDAKSRLLYVGISTNPFQRLKQHMQGADWSHRVATIKIAWFPSRYEASVAEAVAIKAERPRHNVQHRVYRTKAAKLKAEAITARRAEGIDTLARIRQQFKEAARAERAEMIASCRTLPPSPAPTPSN